MSALLEPFAPPFMRLALLEVLMLSVAGGVLGTQIVLRRLAFFTHATGTATFPGLVAAAPLGIPPPAAALAAAGAFAAGIELLRRRARVATDAATAMLLVGSLAIGVVLASDVLRSGAGVDRLLFGTLIGLGAADVTLSVVAAALVLAVSAALGRTWNAAAFDPSGARSIGLAVAASERVLVLLIAVTVVVALDAVGALLVSAIFVLPAATARLLTAALRSLQLAAVALAAAEGVAGLWLAYHLDVPPGPAIAVLGGALFALVTAASALRRLALAGAVLGHGRVGSG